MKRERHLTWDNFRETFIEPAAPALHPVPGKPHIHLFVDAGASRLGLRIPAGKTSRPLPSPLKAIQLSRRLIEGRNIIEVFTTNAALYSQFYHLAVDLTDRVQLRREPPDGAISNALADWKALLQQAQILSLERRIGLMGELWLLERLITSRGPTALASWVGPLGEPHDFRVQRCEIEVKTTTSVHRDHMINSEAQLLPSQGRTLFILSLQIAPAGTGKGLSLSGQVSRIRALLRASPQHLNQFDRALRHTGFSDEDAGNYPELWALRTKPALVGVDDRFPRITSSLLHTAFGADAASRVREIHYRLNLDGLGVLDGSPGFLKIVPAPRPPRQPKKQQ